MKIFQKRILPAVGHKITPQALLAGLTTGKVQHNLGLFDTALDIVYTSSGSAAIVVSLQACKMKSYRKKVIIPAYTCPSVLAAVENVGLQAVLCDLAPGQLNLSESHLNDLLDSDTLAVIYVHLFGLDRRAEKIYKMVKNAGAYLLEDTAQAFGCIHNRHFLGMDGDLSILSFGRGKPLSALHGGAVLVNSKDLKEPVQEAMRKWSMPMPAWFGIYYRILLLAYAILFHPRLFALPLALPWFRVGETIYIDKIPVHTMAKPAKEVLNQLLKKLNVIQQNRARLALLYKKKLMPFSRFFSYVPTIDEIGTGPIRFPLIFKNESHKFDCLKNLSELRLGASGSYPAALNAQAGVPDYVARQGPFPHAEDTADGILTLPIHEYVEEQDMDLMINIIRNIVL